MVLPISPITDNPEIFGVTAYAYLPDQLITDPKNLVTHNVEVMAGILPRGTVMGRQTDYTILSTPGANTGNGTVGSMAPTAAIETAGTGYVLTAVSPTSFTVTDPEGVVIGTATVGTAFAGPEINFTVTAGSTAFVAGDSFTLSYQLTSGNFVACVKTATDGSQVPAAILADAANASAGPVSVGAYFMGEFNSRAVTYDNSWLLQDLAVALQARGIHLKRSLSAADPA